MPVQVAPDIQLHCRRNRFDSTLYVRRASGFTNVDLLLDVYVWLVRIEPPATLTDSNGMQQTVVSWGSDWNGWVNRFKSLLETRLDGKFWFVPDRDWGVKVTTGTGHYVPNIKCGLHVHPVPWGQRYHLQLNCYRVPSTFCPRTPNDVATAGIYSSYMQTGTGPGYGRIVNTDIWMCRTHDTEAHYQEVAAHEFGHFLGLDHVALGSPQCPATGNSNGQACYGATVWQRGDLLGWGNRVEGWHSTPWATRLQRHVPRNVTWKVTMARPAPTYRQTAPEQLFGFTGRSVAAAP